MKTTVAALTLLASAAAFAVPASAQSMEEGLSMLELAVERAMEDVGIQDVDPMTLSLSQLALIKNVLNSDDTRSGKAARIEQIIAR